jgi:hypothetical protein
VSAPPQIHLTNSSHIRVVYTDIVTEQTTNRLQIATTLMAVIFSNRRKNLKTTKYDVCFAVNVTSGLTQNTETLIKVINFNCCLLKNVWMKGMKAILYLHKDKQHYREIGLDTVQLNFSSYGIPSEQNDAGAVFSEHLNLLWQVSLQQMLSSTIRGWYLRPDCD